MRYLITCFFLLTLFGFTYIRKDFSDQTKTAVIYINYPEHSVKATILNDQKKIKTKDYCTYYWYASHDIKQTVGGYDGKLLHNQYTVYYADRNLKEQGNFNRGLKTGTWNTWFPSGKLKEHIHYQNGLRQGLYELYDTTGHLVYKAHYQNDLLNGKTISYTNDTSTCISMYKKGKVISPAQKQKISTNKLKKPQVSDNASQDTTAAKPKSSILNKKIDTKTKKGSTNDSISDLKKNKLDSISPKKKKRNNVPVK
jgi:MORN repeat variant